MSNHDREGSRPSRSDADLARAWREASDEQPPAHLDAAIIAAARKSVPDRGEHPHTTPVRVQRRNWLLQWQPLAAAATVAGLAFVLVQMLPRDTTDDSQLPSADRREAMEPAMAGRAATAPAAATSSAAREKNLGKAESLDAAAWAAKIASLHGSGDVAAAEQSLRAFRAAEPAADTYLPESLRDWARTVE